MKLLDDFAKLSIRDERPQTFMEIARVSRRENVCSNILAFFIDPEKPHGLGTLVLDALVSVGGIAPAAEGIGGDTSVDREAITAKGKKIDILIRSDKYVVVIENKLDARLDNPLGEYEDFVRENFPTLEPKFILLTLKPMAAGKEWVTLRYDRLVKQIRSTLGQHLPEADTRYLTLFLDFLNTLENLERGTRMDPKLIDFLAARHDDVEKLLKLVNDVKDEMKSKTKELRNLIDITSYEGVTQRFDRPAAYLYDDLIHDVPIAEELTIRVETSLFLKGWEIWIWPAKGSYPDMTALLQELEIPFDEYEEEGGVQHRDNFVHKYNEDLDGIRELLQGLIDKLATEGLKSR